jgi:protein dithiol:quinone oxidoreductase
MKTNRFRAIWLAIAGASAGIGLASIGMTNWLDLDPCHLCIFQRLLMLLIGGLALWAALAARRKVQLGISGGLALAMALLGAGTAAYQSWIQLQPLGGVTCTGSRPGAIEIFVEWLGQALPTLFLATGFCEDEGYRLMGLTLANWSALCFLALALVIAWMLWAAARATPRSNSESPSRQSETGDPR